MPGANVSCGKIAKNVARILLRGGGHAKPEKVRSESRHHIHMPIHKLLSFLLFLIQNRIR